MTTVAAAVVVAALAGARMGFAADRAGALVVAAIVAAAGLGMLASAAEGLRAGTPAEAAFPVRVAPAPGAARRARRGATLRTRARRVADALFHPAHRGRAARLAAAGLALVVGALGRLVRGTRAGRPRERARGRARGRPRSPREGAVADRARRARGGTRTPAGVARQRRAPAEHVPSWLERGLSRLAAFAGAPVRESAKARPRGRRPSSSRGTGSSSRSRPPSTTRWTTRARSPSRLRIPTRSWRERSSRPWRGPWPPRPSSRSSPGVVRSSRERFTARVARTLAELGLGLRVRSVRLGRVRPPSEAAAAFAAAASAADVAERVVVEEMARVLRGRSRTRASTRVGCSRPRSATRRTVARAPRRTPHGSSRSRPSTGGRGA